jgi:hypothetical protein
VQATSGDSARDLTADKPGGTELSKGYEAVLTPRARRDSLVRRGGVSVGLLY